MATVGRWLKRYVQNEAREQLIVLLKMKAGPLSIWRVSQVFNPEYRLFGTRPQRAMLARWQSEKLEGEPFRKGRYWYLTTKKGKLLFRPKGRWGRCIKEEPNDEC